MAEYIEKSALVAEIERIRGHVKRLRYAVDANCIVTVRNACECLESSIDLLVNSIDTLEVKEVKSSWSEEDETNLRRVEYACMKFFGGDCSLIGWLRKIIDTLEVKEIQKKSLYVVTRCEEHSDYVEKAFFSKEKAENYCKQFEGNEDAYGRDITEIEVDYPLEAKEVYLKQKSFVKIDRKLLFEICDAILNHYGYSDVNDCPENDSECFWGKWDEAFRKKVENIRRNS